MAIKEQHASPMEILEAVQGKQLEQVSHSTIIRRSCFNYWKVLVDDPDFNDLDTLSDKNRKRYCKVY